MCNFFEQKMAENTDTYDRLLKAGSVSLTVRRYEKSCSRHRLWPNLGPLLTSPRSYHDVVLVASDGEEVKAHKFVLAGLCSRSAGITRQA